MEAGVVTHGTHSCYSHGCRRQECRVAHLAYEKARRRQEAYGIPRRVDAAPFRDLILAASEYNTLAALARMTGIARKTLADIRSGKRERILKDTADDLAAWVASLP
jgi:transcriptional regulator with XRE-family HTH domain